MIKLKTEVNKSAIMRELQAKATEGFKDSWQPELQVQAYMNGVHDLFKLLRLGDVMESDCDHEWLNHSFDHFGFLQEQICDKCGAKQSVP